MKSLIFLSFFLSLPALAWTGADHCTGKTGELSVEGLTFRFSAPKQEFTANGLDGSWSLIEAGNEANKTGRPVVTEFSEESGGRKLRVAVRKAKVLESRHEEGPCFIEGGYESQLRASLVLVDTNGKVLARTMQGITLDCVYTHHWYDRSERCM